VPTWFTSSLHLALRLIEHKESTSSACFMPARTTMFCCDNTGVGCTETNQGQTQAFGSFTLAYFRLENGDFHLN
jgi:hypothetical protein